MAYESPLKYFRDQNKEPDKYRESNSRWHDQELDIPDIDEENTIQPEKKIELLGSTAEKYKTTIDLVKEAKLKEEFSNDEAEKALLENRKEAILKYLGSIINDARNYLTHVNYLQIQKMETYDSPAKYQEAIGPSDAQRSSYHNKMISDLKIAMRLININFNADFPEAARLEGESHMTDRKGLSQDELKEQMSKREYVHFPYPIGVFIDFDKAPKDPQGEREYIAHWALNLYSDLTALETEISK